MNVKPQIKSSSQRRDLVVERILRLVSYVSVLITFTIIFILIFESLPFFNKISWSEFLFSHEWYPLFESPRYGIWALLSGTILTTFIALSIAMPMGIIAAVFLSEFLPGRLREWLKPMLELLAAVPTVVYGYFALLYVTPILQKIWPFDNYPISGFNALSAGLVMGLMIIPYICSLTEDAMRAVPGSLREASFSLGANKFKTSFLVVLPAAASGVISAIILAVSRAFGETMVVAIAAGMEPKFSFNPLQSTETLTAYIVQVSQGDLPHGSIGYQTIYVVGLTLFTMTYATNLIGLWVRRRMQKGFA